MMVVKPRSLRPCRHAQSLELQSRCPTKVLTHSPQPVTKHLWISLDRVSIWFYMFLWIPSFTPFYLKTLGNHSRQPNTLCLSVTFPSFSVSVRIATFNACFICLISASCSRSDCAQMTGEQHQRWSKMQSPSPSTHSAWAGSDVRVTGLGGKLWGFTAVINYCNYFVSNR